ncbi:MAG: hypothetical protein QOF94_1073, partial [Acidobacteriaceae bacterium]
AASESEQKQSLGLMAYGSPRGSADGMLIFEALRGAEAPPFHGTAWIWEVFLQPARGRSRLFGTEQR